MKVKILAQAEAELKDAYEYYDSQLTGLGRRFIEAFLQTVELIERVPQGWRKVSPHTHRINIKGFPYLILYGVDSGTIIITFICHSHRHPDYFKKHFT